jgi:hypothetical protein
MDIGTYTEACIRDLKRATFHTWSRLRTTHHRYNVQQAIGTNHSANSRAVDRTEGGLRAPGNDLTTGFRVYA